MAYTSIDDPTIYFNTKLYTGTGATHNITGVGFQPDWVWIKSRSSGVQPHNFFDSVRGVNKVLYPNNTDQEDDDSANGSLTSFDSDGFTVGGYFNRVNQSGETFVSWNWKASGSTASNTDGTNITSTVSANTTAGFSIVSYTGSGTISDTVGHGLGTTPNVVIIKNRDTGTSGWNVHHSSLSSGYNLQLQATSAQFNSTGQGHIGTVGSSTFGFVAGSSGNDQVNDSSEKYIAYCFAEKSGYSKFGSYTGEGSTDGTFIYTGFKPAWVMTKRTDTSGNWHIHDNKRDVDNGVTFELRANTNDADTDVFAVVGEHRVDFLSNGIKIRTTGVSVNASGGSYIFMAFAESPFVTSTGIPTTAR